MPSSLNERLNRLRSRIADSPALVATTGFLLVFVFFIIAAENFLSPLSLSNILTFASVTGIVVTGTAVLMIGGEFDLSVGSTLAVAGYTFALSLNAGTHPILAAGLALLVGLLLGALNGVIVTGTGIPSFIATLGTMLAYRGLARALGGGDFASYTGERPPLFELFNGALSGINDLFHPAANFRVSILWFLGLGTLMTLLMNHARYGNWTLAVGGNSGVARSQGVPVRRVKLLNFTLAGFFAGLAGVIQFSQRMSIDPLRGQGLELIAVAAAVIGGVRLTGGYGSVLGACIGVLLLQTLEQGLVLMGVPVEIFRAVSGLIILIAVISNRTISGGE